VSLSVAPRLNDADRTAGQGSTGEHHSTDLLEPVGEECLHVRHLALCLRRAGDVEMDLDLGIDITGQHREVVEAEVFEPVRSRSR
jgi:hypothetical protein